jgi:uncharacterized damage-inducible protein DinB
VTPGGWDGAGGVARSSPNAFRALARSLGELADVMSVVSDEQYVRAPVGVINGNLGGHVRHCLDHFETLLTGIDRGILNYDDRVRGTAIEGDRSAAVRAIRVLEGRFSGLDESALQRPVRVAAMLGGGESLIEAQSSIGREVVFVLNHTVHHGAMIAAMCSTLGIPVPERFGYAPATIAHLDASGAVPTP